MKRFSFAFVGMALVLAGCGGPSGSEYLGKWERARDLGFGTSVKDALSIERNGDGFIIRKSLIAGGTTSTPYNTPAVLKDNQLQIAGGLASYTIDKASGHLIPPDSSGGEYARVK
jgi:hypothetical protein